MQLCKATSVRKQILRLKAAEFDSPTEQFITVVLPFFFFFCFYNLSEELCVAFNLALLFSASCA